MKFTGNKIITLALALTMFLSSVDMRIIALELNNSVDKTISYQNEENSSQLSSYKEQEDKQESQENNKDNWENGNDEESKDKENEESKNNNEKTEEKSKENENNAIVDWPDKPEWLDNTKPNLDDKEIEEKIYAIPEKEMKKIELMNFQNLSMQEEVDLNKKIPDNQIDRNVKVFINGEEYKGGNIDAIKYDKFLYSFSWSPKENASVWGEGNWFETMIFKIPGLNLPQKSETRLIINGIRVGDRIATYDPKVGELKYKVVFNRYIGLFDLNTIEAMVQGSASFKGVISGDKNNGNINGNEIIVTVKPNQDISQVYPGLGEGDKWSPIKPPNFHNKPIPFGKGKVLDTSSDHTKEPQIEWRVTYLDELHKAGEKFLKDGTKPIESNGYCIIEDTLDSNQSFHSINEGRYKNAPFYVELPVILVGTNFVQNGSVGDGNYDTVGNIQTYITAENFTNINTGSTDEIIKTVKETPLTWAVVKDVKSKREKLIINLGILGTDNNKQGITWDMATNSNSNYKWAAEGLKKLTKEAENNILYSTNGVNSAISRFDKNSLYLRDLVRRASLQEYNSEEAREKAKEALVKWNNSYNTWRNDKRVNTTSSLKNKDGELIVPLPDFNIMEEIKDLKVNKDNKTLEQANEYQNVKKSLQTLPEDQDIYLRDGMKYKEKWEDAAKKYKNSAMFYDGNRVFGFDIKYRSKSINTSTTTYRNDVKVTIGGKEYTAEDVTENVNFKNTITGNFALGSLVLQKADKIFETGNDVNDIKNVEANRAGLTGAKFNVYCDSDLDTKKDLAKFFDKDASQSGTSYVYSHTGDGNGINFKGEIEELEVDEQGRLSIERLASGHSHYLVEKEAPEGYYLDKRPIELNTETDKVIYKLVPNVSRSIKIVKRDSSNKLPLEGAKFELYKKISTRDISSDKSIDNNYIKVNRFKSQIVNGHKIYWKSDEGSEELITDKDGNLCIHRLDAGEYKIKEVEAPAGYILPSTEYTFKLSEELPTAGNGMDSDKHILINGADGIVNDSGAANVKLNKKDGISKEVLANAEFALFRFTGTEEEWKNNPDEYTKWKTVDISKDTNEYFNTPNDIKEYDKSTIAYSNYKSSILPGEDKIKLVATEKNGNLEINKIPLGHYSIAEIVAPENYVRDYHSFYFDVTIDDVMNDGNVLENSGKYVQLYNKVSRRENNDATEIDENTIYNYKKKAQIALVKYDIDKEIPNIEGIEIGEVGGTYKSGWLYEGTTIEEGKGLSGAVYKLFMERGGSGKPNPDPEELKNSDSIKKESAKEYDECLAIGTTDKNGILRLENMIDKDGNKIEGLNMEEYYMVEVKSPEGYILDQNPILFSIDDSVYPENIETPKEDKTPGLIKRTSNKRYGYGIKIDKYGTLNGEKVKLGGAGFSIKELGATENLKLKYDKDKNIYEVTDGEFDSKIYTSSEGELKIAGLKPGTKYEITEVEAPKGYQKLDKPIIVETAANSNEGRLDGDYLYVSQEIENSHLKGIMKLHKMDAETQTALAGAKFQVFYEKVEKIEPGDPDYDPTNPDEVRYIDVKVGESKTTDANGNIIFENLDWNENYFVKEIDSPDGYILDESKIYFEINKDSFDKDGNPIPVLFPRVRNTKGALGEVLIKKVDKKDNNICLKDAVFTLTKKIVDGVGNEHWVEYGHSIYTTDEKGEIYLILPPGEYALKEEKAPDGYLLEKNPELYYFEVKEKEDHSVPDKVEITIENEKGETGVYLRKTVKDNGIPIGNVTFNFYKGNGTEENKLYFKKVSEGLYEYISNKNEADATDEAITNSKGEIKLILPKEFISGDDTSDKESKKILYKEIKAPEGVILDKNLKELNTLKLNKWTEVNVENELDESIKDCFVEVIKKDKESNQPLKGVKFRLYSVEGNGTSLKEYPVGVPKETDENGKVIFENLKVGSKYHIVEVEALDGYALDETHHEIIVDESKFEGKLDFKVDTIEISNSKTIGSVKLKKVDEDNQNVFLKGAEFELFKKDDNSNWKHYGDYRYITDSKGEIKLKLPLGEYYWIERVAPIGYMIGYSKKIEFKIEKGHVDVELAPVKNKIDPRNNAPVEITKVDTDNKNVLEGAEFELYYRGLDDKYHLFHTQHYITDSKGKIKFDILPIGSYALKEVKSPDGYDLPKGDNMYYFNVEKDKQIVKLEIENKKKQDGGGGDTGEEKPPVDPEKPDTEQPNPGPDKPNPEKPETENQNIENPDKPDKPEEEKPESENQDKPETHNNGGGSNSSSGNNNGTTTNKPNLNDKTNLSKNNKIPKTGDDGNLAVLGSVFLIATIVLIALLRKNNKTKK